MHHERGFSLILAVAALSSLIPPPSHADGENKIEVKGSFRLRAEGNDRTDLLSSRDFSLIRVRPEVRYIKSTELEAVFTPQFSRTMGEPVHTVPANSGINTKQGASGGTTDPVYGVHEAFVLYRPAGSFTFKGGRQVLSYGDELVIGALDWNNTGRSFDAFKTTLSYHAGFTDVFASKITDNNTLSPGVGGDVDFFGLYNGFDFGGYLKAFDLYWLHQRDGTDTANNTKLNAFGIRVKSKVSSLDYRAEYTKETGNALASANNSWQADAEAGFTLDVAASPRLGAGYFSAGSSYNQLYPTAHKWLGYADVLGRRNVTGFVIHASANPTDQLTVKLDYHSFSRTKTDTSAFKINGTTAIGTAAGSTSKSIGSEWDLTLGYAATKDLSFQGGVSLFSQGQYLTDQMTIGNPKFYFAQMEVKL